MNATLTHVCRHDQGAKIAPTACAMRKSKAKDMSPLDAKRKGWDKCLRCEGPVDLERPVVVAVGTSAEEPGRILARGNQTSDARPASQAPDPGPPAVAAPQGKLSPAESRRLASDALLRLILARNDKLAAAVDHNNLPMARIYADDVVALVKLLGLVQGIGEAS